MSSWIKERRPNLDHAATQWAYYATQLEQSGDALQADLAKAQQQTVEDKATIARLEGGVEAEQKAYAELLANLLRLPYHTNDRVGGILSEVEALRQKVADAEMSAEQERGAVEWLQRWAMNHGYSMGLVCKVANQGRAWVADAESAAPGGQR